MTIERTSGLLNNIEHVIRKYDKIAKLTGEGFNIFKILKVTTFEVGMHSAFIAELLNPNGAHLLGSAFLDIFLNAQKSPQSNSEFLNKLLIFDASSYKVIVEHFISPKSDDENEGGRIDILITDKHNNQIIIENKINAGDGKRQLIRYNNYNKNAPIFYLTLKGVSPTEQSRGDMQNENEFRCISYEKDIQNWLQLCLKEAVNYPLLRETIQQYMYAIKLLTGQALDKNMEKEILKMILSNDDFMESAIYLSNNFASIKQQRGQEILNMLQTQLPVLEKHCTMGQYDFPRIEFYFDDWQNHLVGFTLESNQWIYGIKRKSDKSQPVNFEVIKKAVGNDWKTSPWWLCYKVLQEGILDISTPQPWLRINTNFLTNEILEKVKSIINKTNNTPL